MKILLPAQRRALRARAHHLGPCVSIGQQGLTAAVLHEIDVALRAHELVKIRVFCDERDEREAFLARICEALDAAPVQHLGKLLIVWRPAPEPVPAEATPPLRRKARASGESKRGASASNSVRKRPAAVATAKPRGSVRKRPAAVATAKPHGPAPRARRRRAGR